MSKLIWKEKTCKYCETPFGTYSEDGVDYGEHDCDGVIIERLRKRIKELEHEIDMMYQDSAGASI